MEIRDKAEGSVVLLSLRGQWDGACAAQFRDAAQAWLDQGYLFFALDLKDVQYLDSAAVASLVALFKKVNERDGDVKLVGVPEELREVFRSTHLDQVFDMAPTWPEAVRLFSR